MFVHIWHLTLSAITHIAYCAMFIVSSFSLCRIHRHTNTIGQVNGHVEWTWKWRIIIIVSHKFKNRLSGLENGLLGLDSKVNAVVWARNANDVENMDIICFGHLLFEMCAGYELTSPQPTAGHLQLDLERYPQVNCFLNFDLVKLSQLSPAALMEMGV